MELWSHGRALDCCLRIPPDVYIFVRQWGTTGETARGEPEKEMVIGETEMDRKTLSK